MTFLNKIRNENLASLNLVKGYDEYDAPIYAFVIGKKHELERALEVSQRLLIDISERFKILSRGYGHVVSAEIKHQALAEFNKLK